MNDVHGPHFIGLPHRSLSPKAQKGDNLRSSETEEKKEDFRGINMIPTSRDRSRIDVLHGDESVEARSAYLLEELKCGRLTVSDLMGPLYGVPNLTPSIVLPPGQKVFA